MFSGYGGDINKYDDRKKGVADDNIKTYQRESSASFAICLS